MVEGARRYGYSFIAITDHTQSLGVARGMDEARLKDQIRRIRALNASFTGFRVLAGAEINILSDGSLDMSNDVLKDLDWLVASIHSGFQQGREKITGRILKAMENPYVTAIAHPSGRLLGERDAYAVDWEAVFAGAKETGTALEINAYPQRLDLNDIGCRRAKELGLKVVIDTDSHTTAQLENMHLGVSVARRGWLERDDVLNTLPVEKFLAATKKGRGHFLPRR